MVVVPDQKIEFGVTPELRDLMKKKERWDREQAGVQSLVITFVCLLVVLFNEYGLSAGMLVIAWVFLLISFECFRQARKRK